MKYSLNEIAFPPILILFFQWSVLGTGDEIIVSSLDILVKYTALRRVSIWK